MDATSTTITPSPPTNGQHDPPAMLPPVLDNIPEELRSRRQWVLWRLEYRRRKWTKVPFQRDGRPASSTDPATWCSFTETAAAYQAGGFSGVGFVFSADDPFVGIDLDHCRDAVSGTIEPSAQIIIDQCGNYSEVSPSGKGVKIILCGKLPTGGTGKRRGGIEVYQHGRYFTITGRHVEGTPSTIQEAQSAVEQVFAQVSDPPRQAPALGPKPKGTPGDDVLLEKAKAAKNGAEFSALFNRGEFSPRYGSHSEADQALCNRLAFWTGPDPERIDQLFRRSGLMRDKWLRDDYRGETIRKAIEGCREFYKWNGKGTSSAPPSENGKLVHVPPTCGQGRPQIEITTDEHAVNDQVIGALAANDPTLYQRGGQLVTIVQTRMRIRGMTRGVELPHIAAVEPPNLRERITAHTQIVTRKTMPDGGDFLAAAHPPDWSPRQIHARGHWVGIRHLECVVPFPVLREDGSILNSPGYDERTELFYAGERIEVNDNPTADDIRTAVNLLLALVGDFPFGRPEHCSAWLALVLTVAARFAFCGPAPLWMFDANTRGSGKSLLTDVVSIIYTGRDMPRLPNAESDDEMRKRLTSIFSEGLLLVGIDNIGEGGLGCPSLDAALTSTVWHDRLLGVNRTITIPTFTIWTATGNNIALKADTSRRIVHVRLESPLENPEERSGFQHPDLLGYVREARSQLLAAVLTILRGYCLAGKPDQRLTPWGSFEGWSRLVRNCVVWAGLPDPGLTREALVKASDSEANALRVLLDAWSDVDDGTGVTVSQLVKTLEQHYVDHQSLREALLELCPAPAGKLPSTRSIGAKLRRLRGRVIAGKTFDSFDGSGGTTRWRVITGGADQWL